MEWCVYLRYLNTHKPFVHVIVMLLFCCGIIASIIAVLQLHHNSLPPPPNFNLSANFPP